MTTRETAPKGKKRRTGRRIGALLALLLALLILMVYFCFYWQKLNNREKLASFLPAERTIGFLEYNLGPGREDTQKMYELAGQNPLFAKQISEIKTLIPAGELFYQWYSGKGGLAVLTTPNGQGYTPVLFLGRRDDAALKAWIDDLRLDSRIDTLRDEQYLGQTLISFQNGQIFNLLWTRDYLVVADNREALEQIAGTVAGKQPALRGQPDYNQLSSALPEQNIGFVYLNRSRLLAMLSKNSEFLSGRLAMFQLYFPFLNMFASEAASIRLENGDGRPVHLEIKHLSLFNRIYRNDARAGQFPFDEVDYSYSGRLERYLPANVVFRAGGANLLDQRNKMQVYFQDSSGLNDLIFAGTLKELEDALSSPPQMADLDNNFFPIFQKNHLFYLGRDGQEAANKMGPWHFGLLIESDYPEADLLKLRKVVLAAGPRLTSQLTARPVQFTLPDGSTGTEMRAELQEPAFQTLSLAGEDVEQIVFSGDFSILLWADPESKLLVVSNSVGDLEQIIGNRANGKTAAAPFLMTNPTESYLIDLDRLAHSYPQLQSILPAKSLQMDRKFSSVGLLSITRLGF